jgi:nucleotide-binding universal stress UspA family protein
VRAVDGRPEDVLLVAARSRQADLIAVGAGRGGRVTGLVFGSTATRVARESDCSVLISRGIVDVEQFPRRIVVGVDGSEHAADAEAVAHDLADSHGAGVRRVIATTGQAVVDASRDADLLIVGRGGLRGTASLGSVAERVAHEAVCPVLVVRLR